LHILNGLHLQAIQYRGRTSALSATDREIPLSICLWGLRKGASFSIEVQAAEYSAFEIKEIMTLVAGETSYLDSHPQAANNAESRYDSAEIAVGDTAMIIMIIITKLEQNIITDKRGVDGKCRTGK